MLNERLDQLNDYPFQRLGELLAGLSPLSNVPPISMAVGEPQQQPPAFVKEIIARHADRWNRYPPVPGTPEFRAACAGWLARRYRLATGLIEAERQIAPVAGTREGLFMAALLAVSRPSNDAAPVALMPNPFYQVYLGAAVMAGAEPAFLDATAENNFLPDLAAIEPALLTRTRIMYLCSPANPQGSVADLDYLRAAIALARRHDFLLVADECYAEIYTGAAPPGMLEAARGADGTLDLGNLLIFHSLSKRSHAAGLRSGFAVGSPHTIARLNRLRNYGCAATPLPVMEAATALWNDEPHALETRAFYRSLFDAAERILAGRYGFYRPAGGFFLWLDVGDGEAAARKLWAEAGIRTLPGAYVTRPDASGVNRGQRYLRVALVHDLDTTTTALTRMAQIL